MGPPGWSQSKGPPPHTQHSGQSGTRGQGHLPKAGLRQLAVAGDEAACPFPPPLAFEALARLSLPALCPLSLFSPLQGTSLSSESRPKCRLPLGV